MQCRPHSEYTRAYIIAQALPSAAGREGTRKVQFREAVKPRGVGHFSQVSVGHF